MVKKPASRPPSGSNLTSWLSTTGIIKAATDGVSKTLNKLTKDYNAASDRIDAQVARYKEQFTQLDVFNDLVEQHQQLLNAAVRKQQ